MAQKCDGCEGTNTTYAAFSGGREYYCYDCDENFAYPPPESIPADERHRAMLLQTADGRVALKAQMDQELARRRDPARSGGPVQETK